MSAIPVWSERRDLAGCRAMLRHGSRTFYAASFLLPRPVREPASALYAFCRLADDAVDLADDLDGVLEGLHERLDRIYDCDPIDHPADRAFAHVVRRFEMPRTLPDALLEGFLWDAEERRYEDLAALRDYCVRVAGTVGAMMSVLMDGRTRDTLARACDLGVAMQMTNIARDVGEDAAAGRIYLPLAWMREAGIDPDAWLRSPQPSNALSAVVRRLLDEAERLYQRARAGIGDLPAACRPGINAARLLYREIGIELLRSGIDPVTRRSVVPGRRKAVVLASAVGDAGRLRRGRRALVARAAGTGSAGAPPLAEACYLVDAAEREPLQAPWSPAPEEALESRVEQVIDLFMRLETRDRNYRLAASSRRS